jgi:tetratricopeptide (TPR) repeat protein
MYPLVLFWLLIGQFMPVFGSLVVTGDIVATPQEQQELQQLRLEKQIQKQVREEIDRTLSQIVFLLYLTLIIALGLPLFSLGFHWFIQRKLTIKIAEAVGILARLSEQLIKLESNSRSNNQSNSQQDDQSSQQPSDRSHHLADQSFDFQPDRQHNLEKTSTQIQDTATPRIQHQEESSNFSSIVGTKEKIMQDIISHLPPLSQEKIFAGQEAKLTSLIHQLTVLLEDHPNLPLTTENYTNHAHALYFLEQDLAAIALYNHSLNLQPEQPQAWHQKATIHLKQAEYPQAIAAYNQAIDLQADYAPSWYKLAYAYALTGELDLALSHLQRAVNLNPIFRTRARMSPDFEMLKQSDRFQAIINLEPSP